MAKKRMGGKIAYIRKDGGYKDGVSDNAADESKQGQIDSVFKHANSQDVKNWIDNHQAIDFLNPPDSITVGNVKFDLFDSYKNTTSGKTKYISVYQSTSQIKGEYPLFEAVVKEVKKGKSKQYVFDKSDIGGTGLK